MVDIKLYAAPMEGLTGYIWRRAQREMFGGVDKYFTPFLSPNGNLTFQRKELDEVTQGERDTVPQLLTNRGDYFVWAARELYAMGYREVNFNLGCPSGTVTAKHKGASLCEGVNVEAMSNASHVRPPPGHAPGYLSVQWSFAE